jgi:DNA-binding PadR family transcriptional regulator
VAVRDGLLVLLLNGPAYGFQLHGDLAARTGGRRDVNVGQTYATLDRLTGQGLVASAGSTDDGLPLHRLTDDGRRAALAWLAGADGVGADPWHESVDRVLVALSMPGVDAGAVLEAERERWLAHRERATTDAAAHPVQEADGARAARVLLAGAAADAEAARADAMLRWLERIAAGTPQDLAFAPSAERPRRGRRPSRPDVTPHLPADA